MNTSTKEKLSCRPRRRSTWVDENTGRQVRRCARCQRVRDLETDFPPDRPHGKKPSNRYHYRCFNCMWRKMPEVSEDEELRRIDEALEQERQGIPLPFPDPDEPCPTRRGPRVPGRPLAEAVDRLIASQQMDHPWSWPSWNFASLPPHDSEGFSEATCLRLGLWQRRLLDWRKGGNVEVPMADAVLTRSNWMWWDVWNERTVPDRDELRRVARAFGDELEDVAA